MSTEIQEQTLPILNNAKATKIANKHLQNIIHLEVSILLLLGAPPSQLCTIIEGTVSFTQC